MSDSITEAFLNDAESFRQRHCNPDNPAGWLTRDEWNKECGEIVLKKCRDVESELSGVIGLTHTKNLLELIQVHFSDLRNHIVQIQMYGESEERLSDFRNAYNDAALQDTYEELRHALDENRSSARSRRMTVDEAVATNGGRSWATNSELAALLGITASAMRGRIRRISQSLIDGHDVRKIPDAGPRQARLEYRVKGVWEKIVDTA